MSVWIHISLLSKQTSEPQMQKAKNPAQTPGFTLPPQNKQELILNKPLPPGLRRRPRKAKQWDRENCALHPTFGFPRNLSGTKLCSGFWDIIHPTLKFPFQDRLGNSSHSSPHPATRSYFLCPHFPFQ
jgi:hypothetical protein